MSTSDIIASSMSVVGLFTPRGDGNLAVHRVQIVIFLAPVVGLFTPRGDGNFLKSSISLSHESGGCWTLYPERGRKQAHICLSNHACN